MLMYPFLLRGNRIQGLGHARQELHSQTACGPFKGVLQRFGKRLLGRQHASSTHASYPVWHAPAASNQNGAGLDFGHVRRGRKKKKRLPFRPLPDKQNMPITCPAFGHIKQNSALGKVLGYVASQGADRRGGGLTYFSPLARSVTCWESPRTTHSRPPGARVSSRAPIAAHRRSSATASPRRDRSSSAGRWAPRAASGPRPLWPGVGAAASASRVRAAAAPLRSRSAVTRARSPGGRARRQRRREPRRLLLQASPALPRASRAWLRPPQPSGRAG